MNSSLEAVCSLHCVITDELQKAKPSWELSPFHIYTRAEISVSRQRWKKKKKSVAIRVWTPVMVQAESFHCSINIQDDLYEPESYCYKFTLNVHKGFQMLDTTPRVVNLWPYNHIQIFGAALWVPDCLGILSFEWFSKVWSKSGQHKI